MKSCEATFPIVFFNNHLDKIKEYFNPISSKYNNNGITAVVAFEIKNGKDLKDVIETFVSKFSNVPVFFWQEADIGDYEFLKEENIYILPNDKKIVIPLGEEKKKPNMIYYYIRYNGGYRKKV